ncbi:uncharacterized protein LOC114852792 [Betta splendens]|uniref:Uncharacterized protein LOC114852792 n=1 Tax=Betta splendens TaxID=158456 RepID=A0A6P7M500_BETSP|nr:uncharacterized protein LOC114852792 [Betta splendens]
MKSGLPGLFVILLFLSTVSGQGSVLNKTIVYIQNYSTWLDAQTFCRSSYSDLAVLYEQSDVDNMDLYQYFAWISLNKDGNNWGVKLDQNIWVNDYQPNQGCAVVNYQKQRLQGADCEQDYFFFCSASEDKYVFINESLTWSEAEARCKKPYGGLGVVKDKDHLNKATLRQDFPVWTGLHRNGATWSWSAGLSDYRNWALNEPGNNGDCVAISSVSKTMTTHNCSARYPFICFMDNLLLVKENRTWEEALEYCKKLNAQLVSVQPGDYTYISDRAIEADTDEVWTGLRYLAGSWFWVNGADITLSDLPGCPLTELHCGAFSKNDPGRLEARDCVEEKNFLCYSEG